MNEIGLQDAELKKFIHNLQNKDLALYVMEWVLSLFSRMLYPTYKNRLLTIWADLAANPTV